MKVDNKDLSKYLSGIDFEWYDLSLESTRNAKGDMQYNPVNEKKKVILHTKYLTQEELIDFFQTIKVLKELSVYCLNPYTGNFEILKCYRGDRKISMYWDRKDTGILYNPMDISLIEL